MFMNSHSYVLVSDATNDLLAELAAAADIHIIAMPVDIEEEPYRYSPIDGEISPDDFYAAQKAGKHAHTSQINSAVYYAYFQKFLENGQDVLYIGFSSGLSNTVLAAATAMEELRQQYPQRKLYCLDSLCASVGEGLLVYLAGQKRLSGMKMEQLISWVEENKLQLCHWFTVDDLAYLRRGGRISAAAATVGAMIQIKPVMHVDDAGHLINVAKAHGRKKALYAMAAAMKDTWLPQQCKTVFIGQGACLEDAGVLAKLILADCPEAEITVMPIGPIIGAHTGPGVLALFFIGSKR